MGRALRLDDVCVIPDRLNTWEEWQRADHLDIPGLSRRALLLERDRVKLRLLVDRKPCDWLFKRLARIQERLDAAR